MRTPQTSTDPVRWADDYPTRATRHATTGNPSRDRSTWRNQTPPAGAYLAALAELGLDDPTGAAEPYARALELRHAAPVRHDDLNVSDLAARLGAGAIDRAAAAKAVTAAELASTNREQEQRQRKVLRQAAERAYLEACQRIRDAGDSIIVDVLRPVALAALDDALNLRQAARWTLAHDTAALLRQAGLVPSCGAELAEHMYAAPLAVHRHRLDHARSTRTVHQQHDPDVNVWFMVRRPVDPPTVTDLVTAAQHPEWGPGLYTAAEVLDHLANVQRELVAVGRPQPEPEPPSAA
jgi:hypothetical protein